MNHAVNWEAISAIGQIVGAFALVISLIYVASEVRRNTRASQLGALDSTNHRASAFNGSVLAGYDIEFSTMKLA